MTPTDLQDIVLHDPSFTVDESYLYDLLVTFCDSSVAIAVYRANEKEFVAMELHTLQNEPAEEFYNAVFKRSSLLSASGYRKTVFASVFRNSTLVPNPLYSPGSAETHLRFGNDINQPAHIMTDELRQIDARNVHAFPVWLYNLILGLYPGAQIVHGSTAAIDYLATHFRYGENELMSVEIYPEYISMIVTRGRKLLLYNTFEYENAEGLVYFILFACEQLQLNPETLQLYFSGDIEVTDPVFKLAHKYVRNTSLLDTIGDFNYAQEIAAIPVHRYFSLFIQANCVS